MGLGPGARSWGMGGRGSGFGKGTTCCVVLVYAQQCSILSIRTVLRVLVYRCSCDHCPSSGRVQTAAVGGCGWILSGRSGLQIGPESCTLTIIIVVEDDDDEEKLFFPDATSARLSSHSSKYQLWYRLVR